MGHANSRTRPQHHAEAVGGEHSQRQAWHILWEVTEWSSTPQSGPAPYDPLLLKHLGGQLYAVLAEWDLTPLERAVMQGAFLRT